MLSPTWPARIEKRHDRASLGIDTGNVWAFMSVAERTGKCEVFGEIPPTVLPGHNMIDRKSQEQRGLRKQTILAPLPGALTNEPRGGFGHCRHPSRGAPTSFKRHACLGLKYPEKRAGQKITIEFGDFIA